MKEESYMELCIHIDGKENVYLRVPTLWDDIEKQFIGFIKTPITNKLIQCQGKTSRDLENSFNKNMSEAIHSSEELSKEIFEMFMPAWFWEKK